MSPSQKNDDQADPLSTSQFDYSLPEELIAQLPLPERSASRLLVIQKGEALADWTISDLPKLLRPGDLIVLNDTRVIPARLFGQKATGGQVELLIERVLDDRVALAHAKSSKPVRPGIKVNIDGGAQLECISREGALVKLKSLNEDFFPILERCGHVPLPPYIRRPDSVLDRERYQSIWGCRLGAIAAPTASLHFDKGLLHSMEQAGAAVARVTLHVGAGTFKPVRTEDPAQHDMHQEWFEVPQATAQAVVATRRSGGRVIAIGTTVVRCLESAAQGGQFHARHGETDLFILPGYEFQIVDAIVTNFHLPRSTLLMLVCAAAGRDRVLAAYRHAVEAQYRFFSYGDAMWVPVGAS